MAKTRSDDQHVWDRRPGAKLPEHKYRDLDQAVRREEAHKEGKCRTCSGRTVKSGKRYCQPCLKSGAERARASRLKRAKKAKAKAKARARNRRKR